MDALGIINPVKTPSLPAHLSQPAAPVLPKPVSTEALPAMFDVQVAEQKRYETVQRIAQDIANVFIVSDKTFSIFKDNTGQYITRFTSLRDGRVTYIPEPQLLRMSQSSAPSVLKINV